MHAGKGLGLSDCRLPLLYRRCNLKGKVSFFREIIGGYLSSFMDHITYETHTWTEAQQFNSILSPWPPLPASSPHPPPQICCFLLLLAFSSFSVWEPWIPAGTFWLHRPEWWWCTRQSFSSYPFLSTVEGMKNTNSYELKLQGFMHNADTHAQSVPWQIWWNISYLSKQRLDKIQVLITYFLD